MSAEVSAEVSAETTAVASAEVSDETTTAPPVDDRSPWEVALDDLEAEVDRAEALVSPGFLLETVAAPPGAAWTPPTGLGPLPGELQARAVAVFDRQAELAPRVEEAVRAARAHLRAVGSLRTNDTTASVYVDAVG